MVLWDCGWGQVNTCTRKNLHIVWLWWLAQASNLQKRKWLL
jgi:hypothetical protein